MALEIVRDGEWMDVTLVHRPGPDTGPVLVVAGFASGGRSARELHDAGDGTLRRTWRLPTDYLGTYLFWVGRPGVELPEPFDELLPVMYSDAGAPMPDPDHDDRFVYPVDPEHPAPPFVQSIVRGPDSVPEPYLGAPLLGSLTEHRVPDATIGGDRRVWVHESVGVDPDGPEPALMVVLDGGVYAHLLHTPEQVDAMVTEGVCPPMVTVYCHYPSDEVRNAELCCNEAFAEFVTGTLVPRATQDRRCTADPRRTVVAGSSLGGLSAAWLAFRHPERFGNVIAQSGSFWWHPDSPAAANWLRDRWQESGPADTRLYLEMGTFERSPGADGRSGFDHTVDFADAVRAHGNEVVFREFCGGHDFLAWRSTFPRAVRWIADGLPPA